MTPRQIQLLIGAVAAAAAAVVTYALTQGLIDPNIAIAANAIIAGLGGYFVPKASS